MLQLVIGVSRYAADHPYPFGYECFACESTLARMAERGETIAEACVMTQSCSLFDHESITCPPAQQQLQNVSLKGHIVGFSKICPSIETCCGEAQRLGATSFTYNTNSSHTPLDPQCRFFGALEPRSSWKNCTTCRSFVANQSTSSSNILVPPTDTGIVAWCRDRGHCAAPEPKHARAADGSPSVRVTPVFSPNASRPYGNVRLSVVTNASDADARHPQFFAGGYSAPFKYKWTDLYLETILKSVVPGPTALNEFNIGHNVTVNVRLPAENDATLGIIMADPCYNSRWVVCSYRDKLQTFDRMTGLLNAAMDKPWAQRDVDYWAIWGDNFYDQTGEITRPFFDALGLGVKSTLMMTVPGNHDYWVGGSPFIGTDKDQYGNGHMQFYAMDTVASANTLLNNTMGTSTEEQQVVPFDFSKDPSKELLPEAKMPSERNSVWWSKIGNVAYVGFSGAYSFEVMEPYFREACAWLGEAKPQVAFIVGHWNQEDIVTGCKAEMDAPLVWKAVKAFPGCDALAAKDALKYQMGHVHCNKVTEKDIGFMVAGFGMEGCGNFGLPVVDTAGNTTKIMYFPVANTSSTFDNYDVIVSCFKEHGIRACYHLATQWL